MRTLSLYLPNRLHQLLLKYPFAYLQPDQHLHVHHLHLPLSVLLQQPYLLLLTLQLLPLLLQRLPLLTPLRNQPAQRWCVLQCFYLCFFKYFFYIFIVYLVKRDSLLRDCPRIDFSLQFIVRSISIEIGVKTVKNSLIMDFLRFRNLSDIKHQLFIKVMKNRLLENRIELKFIDVFRILEGTQLISHRFAKWEI